MKIEELDKKLEETINDFKSEIKFKVETFDQHRNGEHMTKDDMDEIGRQTYDMMCDFKKHVIEYLKNNKEG